MAAVELGTAHLFGIQAGVGAVTNATVYSFSTTKSFQNDTSVVNEIGNQTLHRGDDEIIEGSISLRIQAGYSEPALFSTLSYDGESYYITSVDNAESNTDYVNLTLSIRQAEYITLV